MLKNISNSPLVLRWDAKDVKVPAGATIDVCVAWNLPPAQTIPLEGVFLSKYPGILERTEGAPAEVRTGVTGGPAENPFEEEGSEKAPEEKKDEVPAEKALEDMTVDELRNFLIERNEVENWNGKTLKADLLKLAQQVKAGAAAGA